MKNKNDMPIESMIKEFSLFDKNRAWIPLKVDEISDIFSIQHIDQEDYYIEKQIQYNLQYLEFLQKIINELFLTSTLPQMMYKNYIITAVSIIENCFYYVLKKDNCANYKKLDFHKMIEKLEKKNSLKYDIKSFPIFNALRELRNFVHIFIGARENTSDYNTIKEEHYLLARYSLNDVLIKVNSKNKSFKFLQCSSEERNRIFKFVKSSNII